MSTPAHPATPATVVRYQTHPEHADQNARLIQAIFAALQRARPAGLRYQALRGLDGVTFTHVAAVDPALTTHPLTELPEFKDFVADLRTRCVAPPQRVESDVLGSYPG